MKQLIVWCLRDLTSILVILSFIHVMYLREYGKTAAKYMGNQFNIIGANSISCLLILNVYYFLENRFHMDSQYMSGMILTGFFLLGGLLSNVLYKYYFCDRESRYKTNHGEYLFMTSVAFMAVSIKLVSEGIIAITVPFAILMGRFIWLDTGSIKSIVEEVNVYHKRIIETSVLLLCGMVLIAGVMYFLKPPEYTQTLLACLYGIIVYLPYRWGRSIVWRKNQRRKKSAHLK